MNKGLILSALILGGAVMLWITWGGDDDATVRNGNSGRDGTTITVTEARPAIEVVRVDAVGSAEALKSITLFPASSGEVVSVNFTSGDRVESGQVLLELDARDARLALELAEAQLADANRTLARYDRAGPGAAFTPTQLDAAQIAVSEARIARDRAQVALDDRTVVAPFSGTVGLGEIYPGDRITTTTPITTLDDRSSLLVRFEVPEAFLGQLSPGTEVDLTPWTSSAEAAVARVADLDSRVDQTTRTFTVRAVLENSGDRWRPGMGFQVRLDLVGRSYLQVPELALQWGANGAYIWTVDGESKARRTPVRLIQRKDGTVLIDGDIDVGQRVVLEGVQKMADGRVVEVVDPDLMDARDTVQARLESGL